jgi:peptidoglycan-associated lipoprotein
MTHKLPSRRMALAMMGSTLGLSACGNMITFAPSEELGSGLDHNGTFGAPTRNNIGVHNGDIQWAHVLGERFAAEVETTINFAFNSADLDGAARSILTQQAAFIRNFPEVRFSVYGHTDAVGSNSYNERLGRRRARAAVNFLVHQGISRNRLQALVSLGETQPVVATDGEERRNRRTVTEVSGFMGNNPMILDGRYAEVVYRTYRGGPGGGSGGGAGVTPG